MKLETDYLMLKVPDKWAWLKTHGCATRWLYWFIREYLPHEEIDDTRESIAIHTCMSIQQVKRAEKRLMEAGLIMVSQARSGMKNRRRVKLTLAVIAWLDTGFQDTCQKK